MRAILPSTVMTTLVISALSMADVYTDPVGDIATGNANLDIASVSMTDDGTDLTVALTVADLDGDWGKYMLFFDWADGGSGDNDNPWFRDVSGLEGMDGFMGSWLDGGGGTDFSEHDGSSWFGSIIGVGLEIDWGADTITWTFIGLVEYLKTNGATGLDFEIGTTGGNGGDPAIDLLGGEATQPGWGGGSTSTDRSHYEFTVIPAPGALMLLGLAGLAGRRRRR